MSRKKSKKDSSLENMNIHYDSSKREDNKNASNSNSTLSLHISAYENTIDTSGGDYIIDDYEHKINKEKSDYLIKKVKDFKQLFISSPSTINVKLFLYL